MSDGKIGGTPAASTDSAPSAVETSVTPRTDGGGKPVLFSDLDDGPGDFGSDPDSAFESDGAPKPKKAPKKDDSDDLDDDDLDIDDEDGDGDLDDPSEDDDLEDDLDDEDESEGEEEKAEEGDEGDSEDDKKLHKVKVNGKEREYTTKQMRQMVASGAHLVEKRQEFEAEKVRHYADFRENAAKLTEANELVTPIYNALKEGKIEEAIIETGKFKGLSKLDMRRKLVTSMIPVVAQRLGLSQQQVSDLLNARKSHNDYLDNQEELAFLKEEKSKPQKNDEASEDAEAEKAVQKFQIQHGVSDHELRNTISWLKQNNYKGRENEITLEVVQGTIQSSRIVDKTFTAIEAVRPSLKSNSKFVDRVIAVAKQKPDWTVGKLARWVEKQARKGAATTQNEGSEEKELQKAVSRKVLKQGSQSALTKSSQGSQKKKPVSFRDLDDESEMFT